MYLARDEPDGLLVQALVGEHSDAEGGHIPHAGGVGGIRVQLGVGGLQQEEQRVKITANLKKNVHLFSSSLGFPNSCFCSVRFNKKHEQVPTCMTVFSLLPVHSS